MDDNHREQIESPENMRDCEINYEAWSTILLMTVCVQDEQNEYKQPAAWSSKHVA